MIEKIDHSGKNFPRPTAETENYWRGCHNHELWVQKCTDCNRHQFYPRMFCTSCMSPKITWVRASGKGKVASFTIVRRAVSNAYVSEIPYFVALIQLDEGPTMMSNVVQCDPEQVFIGMAVKVVFEDWSEKVSIPKFSPVSPD